MQSNWYSVSFLYVYRNLFLLVGEIFFYDFAENIFWSLKLRLFILFYFYYSSLGLFTVSQIFWMFDCYIIFVYCISYSWDVKICAMHVLEHLTMPWDGKGNLTWLFLVQQVWWKLVSEPADLVEDGRVVVRPQRLEDSMQLRAAGCALQGALGKLWTFILTKRSDVHSIWHRYDFLGVTAYFKIRTHFRWKNKTNKTKNKYTILFSCRYHH